MLAHHAYYAWAKTPGKLIGADTLHLYRGAEQIFNDSRQNVGSRYLMKEPREEGSQVGRCEVRRLMKLGGLAVTQRLAYKMTTKRKHSDKVALNLLNQYCNPLKRNEV